MEFRQISPRRRVFTISVNGDTGSHWNTLHSVLEKQLQSQEYIAGEYSIADIATFPWIGAYKYLKITLDDYPQIQRWKETMKQRPAVQAGTALKGL